MPVNKNALLRYRTIDKCLQNRYRRWTLDDLIDACSDALYEFTGKMDPVSKRTVQLDIQKMRSEELGYCAPIVVRDNKYYEYEDPDYRLTDTPLSAKDMDLLGDAVAVLRQLSGFSAFSGMEDIVGKLEDRLYAARQSRTPVIYYETNDALKGLCHIPALYSAIAAKRPVLLEYRSFKAREAQELVFSPYCLKEHRNRWFVFGHKSSGGKLLNLALDRIISVSDAPADAKFVQDRTFDPSTYFSNLIGVTKEPTDKAVEVWFRANPRHAPYVETKPLHGSQRVIERGEDGSVTFRIDVVLNFELERDLLAFGDGVKVLKPERLVKSIRERLRLAAQQY